MGHCREHHCHEGGSNLYNRVMTPCHESMPWKPSQSGRRWYQNFQNPTPSLKNVRFRERWSLSDVSMMSWELISIFILKIHHQAKVVARELKKEVREIYLHFFLFPHKKSNIQRGIIWKQCCCCFQCHWSKIKFIIRKGECQRVALLRRTCERWTFEFFIGFPYLYCHRCN